jgi:hypothetical protein
MPKAKQQTKTEIVIPEADWREASITVVGQTPLLSSKWSEKAIKAIEDKQAKRPKEALQARDPQREFEDSIYRTDAGKPGFIAIAFKLAAVRGAKQANGITMTDAQVLFHVNADIVEIHGSAPEFRRDMGRLKTGEAIPVYRAMYKQWSCTLPVLFNASMLSLAQLVHLFDLGGKVGVGAWRPEKKGRFGIFGVARGKAA